MVILHHQKLNAIAVGKQVGLDADQHKCIVVEQKPLLWKF